MTTSCTEKTALLMAYTEAAKIFSEAVTALTERSTRSQSELSKLREVAEESRRKVERSRTAMDTHIRKHGC